MLKNISKALFRNAKDKISLFLSIDNERFIFKPFQKPKTWRDKNLGESVTLGK